MRGISRLQKTGFLILVIAAIAGWLYYSDTLAIDACLDKGGCWNSSARQCEFQDQKKCSGQVPPTPVAESAPEDTNMCHSIADRNCPFGQPLIITHGAKVAIKTLSSKTVVLPLPDGAREQLEELVGDVEYACPHKHCSCEEDIKHLVFSGRSPGIVKINAREWHNATSNRCSLEDSSIIREPQYIYTSAVFISTAIFSESYCRGCGGSCHGNMLLATYDTETGREYKVRDIVSADNISTLEEAMITGAINHYVGPEDRPGQNVQSVKENIVQTLQSRSLSDAGLYVENGKAYVDIDSFIRGCVDGSFYPVEVPPGLIEEHFLALLKSDSNR
jgi:hypothetical protein